VAAPPVNGRHVLTIDGSQGEGGGQIVRTAVALSLVTGTAFRLDRIRAGRERPGLLPQHVAAIDAAAAMSDAAVDGAQLGSTSISFRPGGVRAGTYAFAVGTAGSATLVLQTLLPPLLVAGAPSTLTLEGGTHNRASPPFDFLARAFVPLVVRMGPEVAMALERYGFYPAGGGRFTVRIAPIRALVPLSLLERGAIRRRHARAIVSDLPRQIAERELAVVRGTLGWTPDEVEAVRLTSTTPVTRGPGNVLMLEVESDHVTEVFTGFGQRGVRAEAVAERAVRETREYLDSGVAVGEHLADQLLIPLALAGGGAFRTLPLSRHATTNMRVIQAFLGVDFATVPAGPGAVVVEASVR
jgi:RNA 3'-terminal phosphate cyclase (ATP)